MKRKILSIMLAFVFVLSSLVQISGADKIDAQEVVFVEDLFNNPDFDAYIEQHLISTFGEEFMRNHDVAMEIAQDFYNNLSTTRDGTSEYPDYYGGMYLNDDGNLVFLIVDGMRGEVSSSLARSSDVIIEYVEFSHNELSHIQEVIVDFWVANWDDQNNSVAQNINTVIPDIINSVVTVYLSDISEEQIETFRKTVIDHTALVFTDAPFDFAFDIESNENVDLSSVYYDDQDSYIETLEEVGARNIPAPWVIHPGSRVENSVGSGRSIGYRARRGNEIGFVTAAHGGLTTIGINSQLFTTRIGSQRMLAGTVRSISLATDSAFVSLGPDVVMTNRVSHNISTTVIVPILNAPAIRISEGGTTSSLVSTGHISQLNVNIVNGGTNIQTIRATYTSVTGDSGGIVVQRISAGNYGVLGMHIGSFTQAPFGTGFVEARRINANLGIVAN